MKIKHFPSLTFQLYMNEFFEGQVLVMLGA